MSAKNACSPGDCEGVYITWRAATGWLIGILSFMAISAFAFGAKTTNMERDIVGAQAEICKIDTRVKALESVSNDVDTVKMMLREMIQSNKGKK